jgi:hypothetical protein
MTRRTTRFKALAVLALLLITTRGNSYSVQTHEEMIDIAWKNSIRPILLKRFPNLTDAQLQEAHAYAYGGCAVQDLGYYPFGNAFFSDSTSINSASTASLPIAISNTSGLKFPALCYAQPSTKPMGSTSLTSSAPKRPPSASIATVFGASFPTSPWRRHSCIRITSRRTRQATTSINSGMIFSRLPPTTIGRSTENTLASEATCTPGSSTSFLR